MGHANRRKKRLFTGRPRRAAATAFFFDSFHSEYQPFTIIPSASKPKRRQAPLIAASALVAIGTALIFVFAG